MTSWFLCCFRLYCWDFKSYETHTYFSGEMMMMMTTTTTTSLITKSDDIWLKDDSVLAPSVPASRNEYQTIKQQLEAEKIPGLKPGDPARSFHSLTPAEQAQMEKKRLAGGARRRGQRATIKSSSPNTPPETLGSRGILGWLSVARQPS